MVDEIVHPGGFAIANNCSVREPVLAQAIVDHTPMAFGTFELVVNNAVIPRDKTFENTEFKNFQAAPGLHLLGASYVNVRMGLSLRPSNGGG